MFFEKPVHLVRQPGGVAELERDPDILRQLGKKRGQQGRV
jgi:hypothetical protein